jgi:hypothetical protein
MDTLGVQVAREYPQEKVMGKFNAFDPRLHESAAAT